MDAVTIKMLNSTFGTSDYKPLDEMILVENKRLKASDNNFMILDNVNGIKVETVYESTPNGSTVVDVATIRPMVDGSIRLRVNMDVTDNKTTTSAYYGKGFIYAYINNTLKYTFFASNQDKGESANVDLIGDVFFNKGDTVTFKFQVKASTAASGMKCTATLNSFYINADVVANLIDIVTK